MNYIYFEGKDGEIGIDRDELIKEIIKHLGLEVSETTCNECGEKRIGLHSKVV